MSCTLVGFKLKCSAIYNHGIKDLASIYVSQSMQPRTMLQIRFHHCAGWSVPSWDAYDMSGFSHDVVHLRGQSFRHVYKILHYNMDLDIRWSCFGFQIFYHGILRRNDRKMSIKWTFSFYSFVELCLHN